jgi:RIO kinase 2
MNAIKEDDGTSESAEEEEEEGEEEGGKEHEDGEVQEDESNEENFQDDGATRIDTALQEDEILMPPGRDVTGDDHLPEPIQSSVNVPDVPAPENDTTWRSLGGSSSHSPSLDGLAQAVESSCLSDIRRKVTSDLSKARSHQQRKYHSKRSTRQAGRPQGSKAKQDKKVQLDRGGIWD